MFFNPAILTSKLIYFFYRDPDYKHTSRLASWRPGACRLPCMASLQPRMDKTHGCGMPRSQKFAIQENVSPDSLLRPELCLRHDTLVQICTVQGLHEGSGHSAARRFAWAKEGSGDSTSPTETEVREIFAKENALMKFGSHPSLN